MNFFRSLAFLSHILFFVAAFGRGAMAEESSPASPVTIAADNLSYEQGTGTYQAEGNVRITYDGISLLADTAVFRQREGEAFAAGNVMLERGDDILHGERIRLNTLTQEGDVTNGDLFVKKPNFHIRSSRMSKLGKGDYRMERGSFTTCDGDTPGWHFTARELDVTLEEYATGKNVLFYVKDIPLLYLPYIVFPVKQERQSGFLLPRIGNSSKKGFNFNLPFYWAMTPSQDVTFDLDLQTRRGLGIGTDYRYMMHGGEEGALRGYGIYDTTRSQFRGEIIHRHVDNTAGSLTLRSDINLATDRDFYRDFADVAGDYNRQFLDSRAALTKKWQDHILTAELSYVENIDAATSDTTLQRLPSISFTSIRRKTGDMPFFFSFGSELVNFYRRQGGDGQRLNLHPTVGLYLQPSALLDVSAFAGYSQRFYHAYGGNQADGTHGAGIADAEITISSRLARVYDTGGQSLPKIRHLLIPTIAYSFIQETNQEDLPFFDYSDRLLGQNLLNISFANYVTGKFTQSDGSSMYRQIMFLRLSQGYQVSGARRDLLTLVDENRTLTDLRLESKLSVLDTLSLDVDSRFNSYRGHFSATTVGFDYTDDAATGLGARYHFSRENLEYFEGRVGVGLVKPFVFNYTTRYSFDKGDFLESVYSVKYTDQCWGITLSYRDRPDNREFMLTFTLAGIGALGPLKTF